MKRLLLIILSVMAFAGMSVAQDIYSVGYYTLNERHQPAVYKNGTKLYDNATFNSMHGEGAAVVYRGSDVYWAFNCISTSGVYDYARICKNNDNSYMDTPSASGAHINALYSGNNLWAVGCMTNSGVKRAAVWRNSNATPFYYCGDTNYDSEAFGVTIDQEGDVWVCGIQYYSSSSFSGRVWKNGDVVSDLGDFTPHDIAVHNGSVYTVGHSGNTLKVMVSSTVLYTLSSNSGSNRGSIYVESGDVYVTGFDGGPDKVWKNASPIYSSANGYINDVVVNTNGIYYAGELSSEGKIWKNGDVLYTVSSCEHINDMYIAEPTCNNSDILSLPFTDSFENGQTSLPCWTKIDVDNNNGTYVSYWQRAGAGTITNIPTGDYAMWHRYHGSNNQEGWLVTPRLFLQPGRDNTTLSFQSYEGASADYTYEGVWISTDSDPTNRSAYTELWTQDSPSNSWKNTTITLDDYQGQAVYIAFKYTGTNGHNWFIDDVSLYESFQPCSDVTAPFVESFNSSINWCWYFIDSDMSGGDRCWQYSSSEQCAYHPWGQQNTPQEGWLISRGIELPAGQNYLLTFDEKNSSSGTNMKNRC